MLELAAAVSVAAKAAPGGGRNEVGAGGADRASVTGRAAANISATSPAPQNKLDSLALKQGIDVGRLGERAEAPHLCQHLLPVGGR